MNEYPLGYTMDATEYDRIADLLTQIHRKVSKIRVFRSSSALKVREDLLLYLQDALELNDYLGRSAEMGLIE